MPALEVQFRVLESSHSPVLKAHSWWQTVPRPCSTMGRGSLCCGDRNTPIRNRFSLLLMGVAYHSCAGVVLRLVVDVGQVAGSFRGIDPGILYIRMLIAPHRSVTANQLYTAGKHFAGGCDLTHIPKIRYIDSLQGRTTVKHNLYIFQTACIKGREIYLNQFTGGLEHLAQGTVLCVDSGRA